MKINQPFCDVAYSFSILRKSFSKDTSKTIASFEKRNTFIVSFTYPKLMRFYCVWNFLFHCVRVSFFLLHTSALHHLHSSSFLPRSQILTDHLFTSDGKHFPLNNYTLKPCPTHVWVIGRYLFSELETAESDIQGFQNNLVGK